MVRQKDSFWEHAEKLGGRFKCKFCDKEFPGGITRVKSHLSGVKGRDIEICSQVSDEVQAAAFLAIGGPNKKAKIDTTSSNVGGSAIPSHFSHSQSMGFYQSTMPEMCKKMDKNDVDNLLAKTVIQNNIAFNVIQTQSFIAYTKGVAEFGPTYKLPSYSCLRTKLVPNCKMTVDAYVADVKMSWAKTGCTLMSDIWSDMKQRAFINIVGYSPGGAVFLNAFEISKDKKTGIFLRDLLSSVIENVGADHVVQFITDNGSNFEAAGDMLIGKFPRMYKTKCAAHGMQLLLKDIYLKVSWVHKVFDDAKLIVTYMYKHTIILSLMREYTKDRELKHPCATRFASNFLMLQSIFVVEDGLRLLVASPEWRGLEYNRKEMAKNVTNIIQSTEFWKEGKEVLVVFEPLVRVLRLVDGEGSTSGYLYEAMEMAENAIKHLCLSSQFKYKRILELFQYRRLENIIHPVHAAAAFFNPSYMYREDFKENREMKEGITYMFSNLILLEERVSFMKEVQLYRMKATTLFTDTALTMLKTSHPRVWWDYCGDSLPVLQKYVVRILSQPCSSSACERNWSAWEAAQTKKRNRLSPQMLDTLVYVRMNTMMMEKFNALEARDLEPINLENLSELPDYVDPPEQDEEVSSDPNNEMLGDGLVGVSMGDHEDLSWLDD